MNKAEENLIDMRLSPVEYFMCERYRDYCRNRESDGKAYLFELAEYVHRYTGDIKDFGKEFDDDGNPLVFCKAEFTIRVVPGRDGRAAGP